MSDIGLTLTLTLTLFNYFVRLSDETTTTVLLLHPFNGLSSRTTWVSRHQKGRITPDFNEARDGGVVLTSCGPYTNHLTTPAPHHSVYTGQMPYLKLMKLLN